MLFVDASKSVRPSSIGECSSYSVPSSSSSSSSSSSTGGPQPSPPSHAGLLDGMGPLLLVVVCSAVAVVLVASVSRYYWLRRRLSRERGDEAESDEDGSAEDEDAAYVAWDGMVEAAAPAADNVAAAAGGGDDMDDDTMSTDGQADTGQQQRAAASVAGRPVPTVDVSDRRYEAHVRLYEALLSEAQQQQHVSTTASITSVKAVLSSASSSSSSSTTLSASSSSRLSTASSFHSSSDSSGSSDGSGQSASIVPGSAAAAAAADEGSDASTPVIISRLTSSVMPHFISEVTDLRILGSGQSGVVYCGYYGSMAVVVKLPKVRSMSAAQWREWQAHLRLPSHPSLVSFVGSLVMYDTNYLVLKWVEQGSLASLLNSPTASRTARWYSRPYGVMRAAADVAQALHHVHRHHLTHRDVSCRNVLVTADGTFVLADLGLAQEPDDTSTSTNTSSVTPLTPLAVPLRWSSPDYLSSHRFTGKSDVWALGVTLWEMASGGRRPYEHISDNRQLQQHIEQGTVGLTVDREWMEQYEQTDEGGLVHTVKQTIDTCMSRDVARRPDAEQLAERVQREMAKWEAEAGEAAERVKAQWAADHANAPRRAPPRAATDGAAEV